MTKLPNVLIEGTKVTHARALNGTAITRCGIEYSYLRGMRIIETVFGQRPAGLK